MGPPLRGLRWVWALAVAVVFAVLGCTEEAALAACTQQQQQQQRLPACFASSLVRQTSLSLRGSQDPRPSTGPPGGPLWGPQTFPIRGPSERSGNWGAQAGPRGGALHRNNGPLGARRAGAPKGPLEETRRPQQRLRPWDNLEIFPLPHGGPPESTEGGPPEELERGLLYSIGAEEGGPPERGGPHGPPTARLPKGEFRPKQSLGQNFLADNNICKKLVKAFHQAVLDAQQKEQQQQQQQQPQPQQQQQQQDGAAAPCSRVVEVGPGTGALTRLLYPLFPDMMAVELDPRAISLLSQRMPGLQVLHEDVLQVNWPYLAQRMQRLRIVGNLPFYLTSQLLFCLLDCRHCVDVAVVTLQKEVAQRLVAQPGDAAYCRLSVSFSLLASPSLLFTIPSNAFYPQPKVESAVVKIVFRQETEAELLAGVRALDLKRVLFAAFGQRRKMLRHSLASITPVNKKVPEAFQRLRPQALSPQNFLDLTAALFGRRGAPPPPSSSEGPPLEGPLPSSLESPLPSSSGGPPSGGPPPSLLGGPPETLIIPKVPRVWRKRKHGDY